MTGPLGVLERSLRDGPPDESGYRPQSFDLPTLLPDDRPVRMASLERVVTSLPARRGRVATPWLFGAAALVVAISLGALGIVSLANRFGVGGPAASGLPIPAVTVPPLTETFVSPRNGFSVKYPSGWTVTPATTGWPPDVFLPEGNPALDRLMRPGAARLIVASQPLRAGQTEDDWLAAFFQPYQGAAPCGGDRSTWPRLEIGGESGYLDRAGCPKPLDAKISERDVGFEALVFSGGRVYQIGLDGDVDLAYFKALLATIQLDPSQAVD